MTNEPASPWDPFLDALDALDEATDSYKAPRIKPTEEQPND